ncbi:MAG: hypothetical protein HND39_10745 [Ignavibacteriota bacterium]|nr:MAG: hypothetical protein EDM72_13700 [Chlorobiota bacterium]MBE7476758.1 hypothetical protein [Ignavibacteriales bacterium]MBL1121989.1 hypothetical protein [Ignavibacteriota bacterium]MCE7856413.1 hypothetical protein [Ignavibacteria bacterium CHB3]MCZ7614005.1 hypothetical protein [Ignavibacteriaceae bacterium]MEB2295032.1 hypothetical protein [Ignavibacteria bacterium]
MNKTIHKVYIGLFFTVGISVAILLGVNGYQYYSTPLEERFFSSQHELLKPSGYWGHGFGIIGTLMMIIGVSTYMIRKRYRKFFNFGYLKHWLEFHIFLCSVGPVLVLYHTSFKFGGIVSVSFWSMVLVVLSGVVGRFIYVQIPRTIQGQELSINELSSMKEDLAKRIRTVLSEDASTLSEFERISSADRYKAFNLSAAIGFIFRDYFDLKKVMRLLGKRMVWLGINPTERKELLTMAKSEIIVARRIAFLRTFQKLFHWWHIFHLPFAITMFVIMIIHVAVTIIFGYKWIF